MTNQGDTYRIPDGSLWLVEQAPDDNPDGAVVFRITVPAKFVTPPPHRHPYATDSWEVLRGSLSIQVEGRWRTLNEGERADVPPGTIHTVANRSGAEVIVRNIHGPANHFDTFAAHVDRLMRARNVTSAKDPRAAILISMLILEYPNTLIPGRPRDRIITNLLASIGRLLGMNTLLPAMEGKP